MSKCILYAVVSRDEHDLVRRCITSILGSAIGTADVSLLAHGNDPPPVYVGASQEQRLQRDKKVRALGLCRIEALR